MATNAYTSNIPATVTITNLLKADSRKLADEFETWNTGLAAATPDGKALSGKSLEVGIEDNSIMIPIYKNKNLYYKLDADSDMTLTANSDEEVLFYCALKKDNVLDVAWEAKQ